MEVHMTPVLPGCLAEPSTAQAKSVSPCRPPAPQEPIQFLKGASKDTTSFRDALHALLQAHEAEIAALQEEVKQLQYHQECHQADQKISVTDITEPIQQSSISDETPRGTQGAARKLAFSEDKKASEQGRIVGVSVQSCSSGGLRETPSSTSANAVRFGGRSERPASTIEEEEYVPRRSSLHPTTVLTAMTMVSISDALWEPWEQNWMKLVSGWYMYAQQNTNQLYDTWIMSEGYLRKVAQNNDNVDIWDHACNRKKQIRRGHAYNRISGVVVSGFSGQSLRDAMFSGSELWSEWGLRMAFLRANGLIAFVEQYIVVAPHSLLRLAWVGLGMLLIFYDVVVVPLQSFDYEEEGGLLDFMKWFQALFWLGDMGFTFLTAVYVDVELVYKLRIIAHQYAASWMIFDICVLLPIWFEQLSLNDSIFGDMRALRIIRMMRFFRLVRLVKFTYLLDEQLKAINSPSLTLVFKLMQLVLGLIMFTHVNACLWYAIGKGQQSGWTEQLNDTKSFYKYLTSVHWALAQFQGTSEIVPGKFTSERAYAVCAVMCSVMIAGAFLSNFTNIIMQLQSLTVERDRQVRDLCQYMRAHRMPRRLTLRVRNYLLWKAKTEKRRTCEALQILPERLVMELQFEIYSPTIANHEFFNEFMQIYPRLSRRVFHTGLKNVYMSPGDLVFSAQESSVFVYFIVSGLLDYAVILRRADEALTLGRELVGPGTTLSEPTLWMQWQHKGTLVSESYCHAMSLNAECWRTMVPAHPPALLSCNLYARRLIAGMAKCYWRCTDIVVPAHIISETDTFLDALLGMTMHKLTMVGKNLDDMAHLAETDDDGNALRDSKVSALRSS